MRPIDRLVSWLGAKRIVADSPGMGWMLVEIVPVMIWTRLTGAFNFEGGVYLVDYLRIVGAHEQHLAWLPLLFFGGTALSALVVLRRRDRHSGRQPEPRRICLVDTTVGRLLWMAALLWPAIALALECSLAWTLGPVLIGILLAQVWLLAGAGAWATWIRAIIPAPQRGPFLAWRNIVSYCAVGGLLTVLTTGGWWPEASDPAGERFVFTFRLFALVGALSLLALWPLARAPRMSDEADLSRQPSPPIRTSLAGQTGFLRYTCWNACNTAAMAFSLTWMQPLLTHLGLGTQEWASWDGPVRIPMFLLGIFATGALLHRLGGARVALGVNLLLALGLLGFAGMVNLGAWILPLAMALDGLGRGALSVSMIGRLHEVIPHGDARFPALWLAAGGVGGVLAAAIQLGLAPWLADLHSSGATALPTAWWMLMIAFGLRVASMPLLVGPRRGRSEVG